MITTSLSLMLLYEMLRIRMVEEAIAARYAEQKMRCPVHLSIGQEAVAVGVCKAASVSDLLVSTHRAHAHYLAKGGDLKAMIAEIYGKQTGCSLGRGGSMHLIDLSVGMMGSTPIVGGSIPIGVGIAFATQLEQRATLIFFGEGATEEGVFVESLNFAALKKLPVVFVCENNLYSVNSPLHVRQPKERSRLKIAEAHGIWGQSGCGNDVEEVYQTAQKAIEQVKLGRGPIYLEFSTYRYREHCGPNIDLRDELAEWEQKCPIQLQKNRLQITQLETAKIAQEIEEAFQFAENSPFPEVDYA